MQESPSTNEQLSEAPTPRPVVPWALATCADLTGFALDDLFIKDKKSADIRQLQHVCGAALYEIPEAEQTGTPRGRIISLLNAVLGMSFVPGEPHEPFKAVRYHIDSRRSAELTDFGNEQINVMVTLAEQAKHPALRARLADVAWVLNRKRVACANTAVEAYVETVRAVMKGELHFFKEERGALEPLAVKYLRRALYLGRMIATDSPSTQAARDTAVQLRKLALVGEYPGPIHWFSDLDLNFGLSDPIQVAADIEKAIAGPTLKADTHVVADLWRLAAEGYHRAKQDAEKHRCQAEAAERFASDAEKVYAADHSAMLAAHLMSLAVARLHGIPGKKDRRRELRHRLIDLQASIGEEMKSHTFSFDPSQFVRDTEEQFAKLGLKDKLFRFATLASPPDPGKLAVDAKAAIIAHPLSSLFGATHIDHEGKTIYKTAGTTLSDDVDRGAIEQQVAQTESIRRNLLVAAHIDPARQVVSASHYLTEDILAQILQYSGFVPHDLIGTFSRGFSRFFQGDFVSALYILAPLLENSLRHVLRQHGHDVTKFDDATQVQEDLSISQLYEQKRSEMELIFGVAIVADIERVFLVKVGPHLRHSIAHGLATDATPFGADAAYACWVIFHLCMLPLIVHRDEISLDYGWME